MNAIELLEALLRGPAGSGPAETESQRPASRGGESRGADLLRDILGGGPAEPAPPSAPAPAPAPASRPLPSGRGFPADPPPDDERADLKDLLRQAREREAAAAAGRPYRPAPPASQRPASNADVLRAPTPARVPARPPAPPARDEEATCLIRAMINAARADGRMDRDEEQKILRHLGEPTPEVVAFIRAEFEKPLDVRQFAWSVPLGLEQKAYALSLSVLELDQREESVYLQELAHGLRLSPEIRAQIHQHFGAPIIG